MGKASVSIEFKFPDLIGSMERNKERIERTIASTIQTQVGLRFDAEGAHNGHPKWEPLKMRQGQILSLTGTLRRSISPPGAEGNPGPEGFVRHEGSFSDLLTEVGTKLIYASVQDKGAVIVPKRKAALRYMNPGTGKFIFSKRSVIPPRPFTDVNDTDTEEMNQTVSNMLAEILEGA